jgi:hypothetical protein
LAFLGFPAWGSICNCKVLSGAYENLANSAPPRRSQPMPPKSPKSPPSEQPELFRSALLNLVDRRHPLVRLTGLIDWERFAFAFGPLYRDGVGRPGLPTRLMVGLRTIS